MPTSTRLPIYVKPTILVNCYTFVTLSTCLSGPGGATLCLGSIVTSSQGSFFQLNIQNFK
jgi:hypothetical protein